MFQKGLTSVTFRKLTCEKIIRLTAENGLDGIEWGGDIHVPPGNYEKAAETARLTKEAGLRVLSYGSYYNLADPPEEFKKVCATAEKLGAPVIRVWSGRKGSAETTEDKLNRLAEHFTQISEMALKAGINVSTEFHPNSYTDNAKSCLTLLTMVGAENAGTYWQPIQTPEQELEALPLILPYLTNVHVFYWDLKGKRYPLEKGEAVWRVYAEQLKNAPEGPHSAMLEFIKHDSVRRFPKDAKALREIF